jgi:hypothetical protein
VPTRRAIAALLTAAPASDLFGAIPKGPARQVADSRRLVDALASAHHLARLEGVESMQNNEELTGTMVSADAGRVDFFTGDVMRRYWDWQQNGVEAAAKRKSAKKKSAKKKSTKKKSTKKRGKRKPPPPPPTRRGPGCDTEPANSCSGPGC